MRAEHGLIAALSRETEFGSSDVAGEADKDLATDTLDRFGVEARLRYGEAQEDRTPSRALAEVVSRLAGDVILRRRRIEA